MKIEKEILDLLVRAEKMIDKREYAKGLESLVKVKPLLEKMDLDIQSEDDYYSDWGFYYQSYLDVLEDTEKDEELVVLSKEIINKFEVSEEVFYSQEYKIMRFNLRRAYGILSGECYIKENIKSALEYIVKCFDVKVGRGEYLDPFTVFYQLNALIYLEASKKISKDYLKDFYKALLLLEKKAEKIYEVEIDNAELKEYLNDEKYIEFKNNDPLEILKKGKENETWQEAIERFCKLFDYLDYEDDDDYKYDTNSFQSFEPIQEEELKKVEEKLSIKLPKELKNLYMTKGNFNMRDTMCWESMILYIPKRIDGLVANIDDHWGGRPEFEEELTEDEINYLNDNFKIFGYVCHNDNSYTHLYFTSDGTFGQIYYDQDDWDSMYCDLSELLREKTSNSISLDNLISWNTNIIIDKMVEEKEEEENEGIR